MSEIVVIIRPSFMKFCQDGCRAALFNHILYWIAKKVKGQPQEKIQAGEITYYATTEGLAECLADAWGYQKVRKEVNGLIDMGIIGRGKNPAYGADRTKHFFFGKEQCDKLLELCQKYDINLLKIGLPSEMTDLIKHFTNSSNANDESVKCYESPKHNQFTNMANANDKSVRPITKIATKGFDAKGESKEQVITPSADTSQSSQPNASSSPSLSQNTSMEDWLIHFDQLYRKKSGIANYRYSRKDTKINEAIGKLIETGATFEQVEYVFNDIWEDKDPFWQEHKGKIWVVESQFATRVAKMNQPAPKRQTASGFTNWTEDKTMGAMPSAPKATEKPERPPLPAGYTRLKIDKPRGPRSLQARLEAQQKGKGQA